MNSNNNPELFSSDPEIAGDEQETLRRWFEDEADEREDAHRNAPEQAPLTGAELDAWHRTVQLAAKLDW